MAKVKEIEKVKPAVISDPSSGESYTLTFTRSSVRWAENHGFDINAIANGKYLSGMSDLFYYSFRANHPNISREKTDSILFDGMGGMPEALSDRLAELYASTLESLVQTEERAKNSPWTVNL